MEDRFKFRVWDKKNKTFWYNNDDLEISDEWGIYVSYYEKSSCCGCCGDDITIHGEDIVVMQCTGLKIKDKLLYEKDKVKLNGDIYIVEWDNKDGSFMLHSDEFKRYLSSINGNYDCEIVGNEFEQPPSTDAS